MKAERLFSLQEGIFKSCTSTLHRKNHDYSPADDALANFKISKEFLDIDPGVGLLLRVFDKLARLSTFHQKGELRVAGEGYIDACEDIINYMILLSALHIEEFEDYSNMSG